MELTGALGSLEELQQLEIEEEQRRKNEQKEKQRQRQRRYRLNLKLRQQRQAWSQKMEEQTKDFNKVQLWLDQKRSEISPTQTRTAPLPLHVLPEHPQPLPKPIAFSYTPPINTPPSSSKYIFPPKPSPIRDNVPEQQPSLPLSGLPDRYQHPTMSQLVPLEISELSERKVRDLPELPPPIYPRQYSPFSQQALLSNAATPANKAPGKDSEALKLDSEHLPPLHHILVPKPRNLDSPSTNSFNSRPPPWNQHSLEEQNKPQLPALTSLTKLTVPNLF